MHQYNIVKVVGDGAYGVVSKAVNVKTGEVVAVKTMRKKFLSWEECIQLREIKSLKKLAHPNIVKLKEVIRASDTLHLIFEYCETNLYQTIQSRTIPFTEKEIRHIIHQTLLGLAYAHKNGFFHRDIKPENLLINTGPRGDYEVKMGDFGQAREIRSKPPYTEYISTRWYRAPECLLRSTVYNSPMDVFALGCIMAELFLNRPLFPGSSENDQLYKICSVVGTPTEKTWGEGLRLGSKIGYVFPSFKPTPLASLIPNASKEAIDLITHMLILDPQKRITAAKALNHPYFTEYSPNPQPFIATVENNEERKLPGEEWGVIDVDDITELVKGSRQNPPEEQKIVTTHSREESKEEDDLIDTILAEGDMIAKEMSYSSKTAPKHQNIANLFTETEKSLSNESNYSFHQKQMRANANGVAGKEAYKGSYGYGEKSKFPY
eukprot:TRINITY_DN739_c0_g8_i1.p1 TRINITY_DN739_c0_g8~~TRINITY_DN739_c0_g8_i1.p1  ORF type:complete len:435 (-),score=100.54 TRINITY_DN739_c0_g8_i1:57-1361(-)